MKLITVFKKWSIYAIDGNEYKYSGFLPGDSPRRLDTPEWEDDSLEALKDFIRSY